MDAKRASINHRRIAKIAVIAKIAKIGDSWKAATNSGDLAFWQCRAMLSSAMQDLDFNSRVRLEIYRQFIAKGSCPGKKAVAEALGTSLEAVRRAYSELAGAHMLVLQPENGEVLMASPLSAVPTPFLVETRHAEGSRSWYGNCIWDALGVISMLATDGRVLTSCGCCGEKIEVGVESKNPFSRPESIVHFAIPARRWWDDIVFN